MTGRKRPGPNAGAAQVLRGAARGARDDADRDDHDLGVLDVECLGPIDAVAIDLDLVEKALRRLVREVRLLGRKAVGHVGEAGHVDAMAIARPRHDRHEIVGFRIRQEMRLRAARPFSRHRRHRATLRENDGLQKMRDHLIVEQDDGRANSSARLKARMVSS